MGSQSAVHDSPTAWVRDHIRRYVETGGKQGHAWHGTHTLLLTVTGRKSGVRRRTALIYGRDGDSYVVVASKGGAAEHPEWYRNILADPQVEVQIADRTFAARARTASPAEKERLWPVMLAEWPAYADYQRKTDRDIPVVILEPQP